MNQAKKQAFFTGPGRFVCHIHHFTARSTIILPSPNTRLN